jgi:hypothetical protein
MMSRLRRGRRGGGAREQGRRGHFETRRRRISHVGVTGLAARRRIRQDCREPRNSGPE